MKEEQPHIIATCSACSFRFDILFGTDCPRCRTEAVKKAFAPVDALRTALGVGLTPDPELEGVWHWHGEPYMRGSQFTEAQEAEVPRDCFMPVDDAEQVYYLRLMFRR